MSLPDSFLCTNSNFLQQCAEHQHKMLQVENNYDLRSTCRQLRQKALLHQNTFMYLVWRAAPNRQIGVDHTCVFARPQGFLSGDCT